MHGDATLTAALAAAVALERDLLWAATLRGASAGGALCLDLADQAQEVQTQIRALLVGGEDVCYVVEESQQ